jgi:putative transposase
MSFVNNQFHFLKALPVATNGSQLEIPDTPPDAGSCQGYLMHAGDRYIIYSPGRRMEGHYVVHDWLEAVERLPRRVHMRNVISNSDLFLTPWQISTLECQRRIRPVSLARAEGDGKEVTPGISLLMDDARRVKAERYLGYVRGCIQKFADVNDGKSSRRLAEEAIDEHAEAISDPNPPCFQTVWDKLKAHEDDNGYDPLGALADKSNPGNTKSTFGALVEQIVLEAAEAAWRKPNGDWRTLKSAFRDKVNAKRADQELPPEGAHGDIKFPSDRTFQRRMYEVNKYDRLRWRFGEDHANRVMACYIRQALPDFPLDIVDVDHTTFNIVVIDDKYPVAYGRPDLIVFRDRKTGSPLAWPLSFQNPSYESFLHGLRIAIFPKDMSAYPGIGQWPYGRPFRLGVDNALHFLGDNIDHACQQLGMTLVEYRPGHPWEKGALERLNGILGVDVALGLPGATGADPKERDLFDEETGMAAPVLTLSELQGFLDEYFSIYIRTPHEGLGFLRTLKGIPLQIWREEIKHTPDRPPLDPNIFIRLAGDVHYCSVQPTGIRLDYITYQSEQLLALRAHPKHKEGKGRHRGTKYRFVRDPSDLGRGWVWDPYRKVTIEVEACSADYSYANGLRLFQHTAIIKYWRETHGEPENAAELQKAMDDYQLKLVEFHQRRRKHGTALKLARFLSQQGRKVARSRIVEAVTSAHASTGRMNVAEPFAPPQMEPRSTRASRTASRTESAGEYTVRTFKSAEAGFPVEQDPVLDSRQIESPRKPMPPRDIEFLKSKHEGYD